MTNRILPLLSLLPLLLMSPMHLSAAPAATKTAAESTIAYELAMAFDLENATLHGTAAVNVPGGEPCTLYTGHLQLTGLLLKTANGESRELAPPPSGRIALPAVDQRRQLFISYTLVASGNNQISPAGIALIDSWHPLPDRPARFSLAADIPAHFQGLVEADTFPLERREGLVHASFSFPTLALHFIAGPYEQSSHTVRPGLLVHTLFFAEDQSLAEEYLEAAAGYLARFEKSIGPFPYNHYVVAANRKPTGLGMPTFTLLGQQVIRLPFIKETSLGHEVLHSWFGNSITIDPESGNWAEGLTSYLADHAFSEDRGEGLRYRLEAINTLLSYGGDGAAIPLASFLSASHDQEDSRSVRAVGYSRAMLLFHELRELLGSDAFNAAIKNFAATFAHRQASWQDLEQAFSVSAEQDLKPFFTERLSRRDIPHLSIENLHHLPENEGHHLEFDLVQHTSKPYTLQVPLAVTLLGKTVTFKRLVSATRTPMRLTLEQRPLAITLDPEISLLRILDEQELAPSWSRLMGATAPLVLAAGERERQLLAPLLASFPEFAAKVKMATEVAPQEWQNSDLLLLGHVQPAAQELFGELPEPSAGFGLQVRRHPLAPGRTVVLVSSSSVDETAAVASRLGHYGQYSSLQFQQGRPLVRQKPAANPGITSHLESLPQSFAVTQLQDFSLAAQELATNDVIYLGEIHTSVSDHRLQLRLLEALSAETDNLAIGMEMFPTSSQEALDRYILEKTIDERDFIKQSRYFEVWGYDFRLFRELLLFARQHHIPVIGLNVERHIVSSVFTTGSTSKLSEEDLATIPEGRDLSLPGYRERLTAIHRAHGQNPHGRGEAAGFIQAQAIWDEAMAANIVAHLASHPGRTMLVLAGSQHTRKDSGIPPRVARRMALAQAVVANLTTDTAIPENVAAIADRVFLSASASLPPLGRIGVTLKEKTRGDGLLVTSFGDDSKAALGGLQIGDTIVEADGYPISALADLRIAMLDKTGGDRLTLVVVRFDEGRENRLELEIELTAAR